MNNILHICKSLIVVFFILAFKIANAQLAVDNAPPNNSAAFLVNNILINDPLVNTSNISFTGNAQQIGYFNSVNSNVGIETGIILSTGEIWEAPGPNNSDGEYVACISTGNSIVENEFNINSNDAANLTFNFIAQGNSLDFNYVFASEEYPEWVGGFNDAFGFFLSGPNPDGPNYNNYNIALLPNGDNVSINNVNEFENPELYNANDNLVPNNQEIQYDGFTDVLTASANLICGEEYTIQLIIADAIDCNFSSAVFLQSGSFDIVDSSVDASIDLTENIDEICAGEPYYLSGSTNASSHLWTSSGDGVFDDPNLLNSIYTPGNNDVLSGSVNLTLTADDNCGEVFSDNLLLNINALPIADAGVNSEICEGETYTLNGFAINTNSHTWVTSGDGFFDDSNSLNAIYTPGNNDMLNGSVMLSLTAASNTICGEATDDVIVSVNPLPNIDAGLDFAVCGLTTNLNGISSTSNNTWSANDITFANINNLNTDITANYYGVQTITLNAEEDGCLATPDNVNITFLAPPIVDAGSDIDICSGENIQLNGYGNGNILWSPSTGLNDPTLPNPIVSGITDSTLYTLTVTNTSVESVYNGDFELGNTGFSSDYYVPTFTGAWGLLSSEGTYTVDNNGSNAHVNFVGFDNTNPPNGNFLIVNGASSTNTNIWCQDIVVAPNTNYEFSVWVSTMVSENPAILEFSINESLLGNPFSAPNTTNTWNEYTASWYSGTNTTANICIVNQNTSGSGNDFGIDDISFSAVCSSTDEVWVNVQPIIEAINQTPSVCEDEFNLGNSEVDLTLLEPYLSTNSNAMVDWFNNSNLTSPIINPDNFIVSENQTVYAALSAPLSCENTAVVTYNINPMPEANNIIASFCEDLENDILIDLTTYENQISSNATTINWFNLLGQSVNTNYPLLESGILLAQITNNFNCENAAKLILELNSTPNISAITSDEICQSENYNLASININDNNTGGSISFHSESPANPSNQISSLVSPNTSSLYYILSTTEEGCKDETSFNLTVNPIPTPDAGSDESVCGLSTILNASLSIGVDNNWANISDVVFSNSENPMTTATVSEYGTYSFVWEETSEFGCYNNSTVNIEFIAPPTTNSNITNISICPGEEVFLQASAENYTSFAWSSSGSGTFSDYLSENTIYTPSNEDVSNNGSSLTFTALNNVCPPSSSEISLNIHNTPIASIEGSGDLCANTDSTAAIILYTNNGVSPYELSITHNGVDWIEHTIYGSSDTIFTEEEGFYTISSLNDTHCSGISSGEISIYYRPIPYAEFSFNPSVAFLGDSEISFYNHSLLADSFTWSFGDDTYNNLEFNPTHLYTDTGTFTISLVVSNEFGCEDSVRHTVIINPNFHFFVPNVFTPNGDLQNDVFSGKGDGIAYFEMTIFNRWGSAIFNTNDMEKGWDGTPINSSKVSPNGVYSYKITVTDLLGKIHTYTGKVSLLR